MLTAVAPWRHAVVPVSELERTRIFDAARDGDLAVPHALVRRENVNAVRSSDADVALITPLLMAVEGNHVDCARLLINRGAALEG